MNMEKELKNCYPIIKKLAGKMYRIYSRIDYDDYLGLGHEVFMDCWEKYNEEKGAKFTTFFQNQLQFISLNFMNKHKRKYQFSELKSNKPIKQTRFEEMKIAISYSNISAKAKELLIGILENRFSDTGRMKSKMFSWTEAAKQLGLSVYHVQKLKKETEKFVKSLCY